MNDKKQKSREKVDAVMQTVLDNFANPESLPKAVAFSVIKPPANIPMAKWSLTNRMLTYLSGTADARGYRQWEAAGRAVKKGSKAIYIISPRMGKAKNEDGEEELRIYGFSATPVFKIEDTEGETPPEYADDMPTTLPVLSEVAQAWSIDPAYAPSNGTYGGYYRHRDSGPAEIVLCSEDESVWFHELVHAAHYRVRPEAKTLPTAFKEVVAELGAAALMHLYSREPHDGFSYQYIKAYAAQGHQSPSKACMDAMRDTAEALTAILSEAETLGLAVAA
jgi:hypothetical protein